MLLTFAVSRLGLGENDDINHMLNACNWVHVKK